MNTVMKRPIHYTVLPLVKLPTTENSIYLVIRIFIKLDMLLNDLV